MRLKCIKSGFLKYSTVASCNENPKSKKKVWSPEAKANCRMKNLEKRILKKDPMFYEWALEKAISEKPGYYNAEYISENEKDTNQIMDEENEKALNEWGNLVIDKIPCPVTDDGYPEWVEL